MYFLLLLSALAGLLIAAAVHLVNNAFYITRNDLIYFALVFLVAAIAAFWVKENIVLYAIFAAGAYLAAHNHLK